MAGHLGPPAPSPLLPVLPSAIAGCPELLSLLDEFRPELDTLELPRHLKTGQQLETEQPQHVEPFTDATWLAHLELLFVLRSHRSEAFRAFRKALAAGPASNGEEAAASARQSALLAVEELLRVAQSASLQRLARAESPPLVVRLVRRYALPPAEGELLQLLFMRGASRSPAVRAASAAKCDEREQLMEMCGMSSLDLEEFLDDKRTHIVEGIVLEAGDEYEGKTIRMASEAVSALLRRPLKTEQRLKLSKTELLNVMEASEGKPSPSPVAGLTTTEVPCYSRRKRKRAKSDNEEKHSMRKTGEEVEGEGEGEGEDEGEGDGEGEGEGEGEAEDVTGSGDLMGELRQMGLMQTVIPLPARMDEKVSELNGGSMESEAVDQSRVTVPCGNVAGVSVAGNSESGVAPYESSLEYLDDAFQILALLLRIAKARHKEDMKEACNEDRPWYDSFRPSKVSSIRELRAKLKYAQTRQQERMKLTEARQRQGLGELPRLEALARKFGLDEFEKSVIVMLAGVSISPIVKSIFEEHADSSYRKSSDSVQVKDMITVFFDTFKQQVLARPYFYKTGRLVARGVVRLRAAPFARGGGGGGAGELLEQTAELDRRLQDWLAGLDAEQPGLAEGSHLYTPKITMEQVVLPDEQKELLLRTVDNFAKLKEYRRTAGLEEAWSYGAGLVILLCGASGTGKTMTVNALANHLGKRVLLVDFQSLYSGSLSSGRGEDQSADLRGLFRDAGMNDAVIFFDECEAIFAQRERGGDRVLNSLLTEMERHEGIIMLATNRPLDLDEAMHRRITCVSEFRPPDHTQRRDIWRVASKKLPVSPDIDWDRLALRYELTGGFIKNALVSALLVAISRDGTAPLVVEEDVVTGCSLQMRGSLQMKSFSHRVVPRGGVAGLALSPRALAAVRGVVAMERSRAALLARWAFQPRRLALPALFWGARGTGKSAAAEAVGFEVGRPLKVVSCAQLLSPAENAKTGSSISAVFKDARLMDALLVLEDFQVLHSEEERGGAEGGVSSVSPWSSAALGLLLHELQNFPGTCILIANIAQSSAMRRLDPELLRRLKFVVEFKMPDAGVRAAMWRKMLPSKVPLEDDVNFEELGRRFEFASGAISSATVRAAAKAVLRPSPADRVSMRDLTEAAQLEQNHLKDEIDEIVLRAFI